MNTNTSYQGETIEQKMNRVVNNKEPIKDGAPIIYTERKEGVNPAYDIRTDRFELAIDATTHITKTKLAERLSRQEALETKKAEINKVTGGENIQAT